MTTNLVSIDYLIILLYFVVVFLIAWWVAFREKATRETSAGYFLLVEDDNDSNELRNDPIFKMSCLFSNDKGIVCPILPERSLFTSNRCLQILWQYKLLI